MWSGMRNVFRLPAGAKSGVFSPAGGDFFFYAFVYTNKQGGKLFEETIGFPEKFI